VSSHVIKTIPERVELVKRIFAMALSGYGVSAIASKLNQEGLPLLGAKSLLAKELYHQNM
jgi:hypothetical protein